MRHFAILLALSLLFLMSGSEARTWRSAEGSLFSFHPNGTVKVRHRDGTRDRGRWWWINENRVLGYSLEGQKGTATVTLDKRTAVVQWQGQKKRYWFVAPAR